MHTVSACILSYNRPAFIGEAIASVLQQTVKPTEILILDNASDAQVLAQVRPYLDQGVRWMGADSNQGAIWNFRRALQTAQSDFLFVLHDDDRLCPNFIEKQLQYLVQHPDVGAITCNGYVINIQGERMGTTLSTNFAHAEVVERYINAAQVAACYAGDSCLPFSPMMYRAEFVRHVPLRDEFGKVADAVFFCDLADAGTLAYQARPLYECRAHADQDSGHFPAQELAQLTVFFASRTGSAADVAHLQQLLVLQHTARQLRNLWHAVHPWNTQRLRAEIAQLQHPRFRIAAAVQVCWRAVAKRVAPWLGVRTHAHAAQASAPLHKRRSTLKQKIIKLHFFLSEQLGINPLRTWASLRGTLAFVRDLRAFRRAYTGPLVLSPCLGDRYQEGGSTKNEYFWQDLLVARHVFQHKPLRHVDVGSRIDGFVAHVASFRIIEVFDIRPVSANIPGVIFRQADLMSANSEHAHLQEQAGYCDSLSCLHALEHFGLGRYGDPVNPQGYQRGMVNLARLLQTHGRLYLSTPIGSERVEFNANWVFDPQTIVRTATPLGLALDTLTVLDQQGGQEVLHQPSTAQLQALGQMHYRLGIFQFTKVAHT